MQKGYNTPPKKTIEGTVNGFLEAKEDWKKKVEEIDENASLYPHKKRELKNEGYQILQRLRDEYKSDINAIRKQELEEKKAEVFKNDSASFPRASREFADMDADTLKKRMKYYRQTGDEIKVRAAAFAGHINGHGEVVDEFISNSDPKTQQAYEEYKEIQMEHSSGNGRLEIDMALSMPPKP
ncbi:MAG: hypothetical protein GVY20_13925 [Bacteroidetes bacterium]|jgi:sulfur relay (sulfurtransferase) DsrC/TusE family protein|nr:hypothetical protein [Bacteroidota bacterium]